MDAKKFFLESWQVLSLIARLLVKADGSNSKAPFSLENLDSDDAFSYRLSKYKQKAPCNILHSDILKRVKGSDYRLSEKSQTMYEFLLSFRNGEPVVVEESFLNLLIEYINQDTQPNTKEYYSPDWRTELTNWKSDKNVSKLYNSCWWLYFRDREDKTTKGNRTTKYGITKALLLLLPFGKVEIKGFDAKNNTKEDYIGQYKYHINNNYIVMTLSIDAESSHERNKTSESSGTPQKDLHIIFYINSRVSLSLGQYHNVGRTIYSGTILVEPVKAINDEDIKNAGLFYPFSELGKVDLDNNIGPIPWYAHAYLKDKSNNIMRSPSRKITNETEFYDWHKEKNPGQYPDA